MKMQKLIINFILSLLFFASCTKDNNPNDCHTPITTYYKLENAYKQNIPYTGKDTLKFIDTAGNTLTFIGQGIDSNYLYDNVTTGNPGCPQDKIGYQYFKYKFKEIDNKASFQVNHYKNVEVPFYNDYREDEIEISFNQNDFYNGIYFIGDKTSPRYYPKINFGSQTYYDLLRINITYTDTSSYLFVNLKDGVVFVKNNLNKYTLIK